MNRVLDRRSDLIKEIKIFTDEDKKTAKELVARIQAGEKYNGYTVDTISASYDGLLLYGRLT